MKLHEINIDEAKLAEFCRANGVRELLLFGSITRDDFRPDSDIDVIAHFEPGAKPSLWDFAGVELDLSNLLGRPVHLHTPSMIHPYLRKRIEQGAKRVYAA